MHPHAPSIHQLRILYRRHHRTIDDHHTESHLIGFQHSWWLRTWNKSNLKMIQIILATSRLLHFILAIDKVAAISHDRESPDTIGIFRVCSQLPKFDGWSIDFVSRLCWICRRLQYHQAFKFKCNFSSAFIRARFNVSRSFQGKADDSTKKIVQEPSPVKAVVKKVIACAVCAYIYIRFINMYPIRNLKGKLRMVFSVEDIRQPVDCLQTRHLSTATASFITSGM